MTIKPSRQHEPPRLLTLAFAAGSMLLAACAAQAESTFDPANTVVLPGWQLQFENMNPVIKMAAAYGDRSQGAHGSFGKFPPKFTTPLHTHSAAYHGIVLKGIMTNPFEGEESPSTMEPGSYWYVPAGASHATACVSDTPCEFYFHSEAAFDFHPVE